MSNSAATWNHGWPPGNEEEFHEFDARLKRHLDVETVAYLGELKIDGLSIALHYRNGELERAVTRGDCAAPHKGAHELLAHPPRASSDSMRGGGFESLLMKLSPKQSPSSVQPIPSNLSSRLHSWPLASLSHHQQTVLASTPPGNASWLQVPSNSCFSSGDEL